MCTPPARDRRSERARAEMSDEAECRCRVEISCGLMQEYQRVSSYSEMKQTAIRSHRVVLPDGLRAASVNIDGDRIARIGAWNDVDGELIDVGDLVVMPG